MAKLKELLLDAENIPILAMLYGSSASDELLTLPLGEDYMFAIVSDGTFLYVANTPIPGEPSIIIRVDLATFTRYDSLTLDPVFGAVVRLVTDGSFLYASCQKPPVFVTPGAVVKIDIQTFLVVDSITLPAGDGTPGTCTASDGTFLYVGELTFPARIAKIDIRTFTYVSTLILSEGRGVSGLATDGQFVYVDSADSPGIVFKIDISTFTEVAKFTLNPGEDSQTLFIHGQIAYISTFDIPSILVKVDLTTFSRVDAITLSPGNDISQGIFIDGTFIYVSSTTAPANVAIVDISTFTEVLTFALPPGADYAADFFVDQEFLYFPLFTSPGTVFRKFIFPTDNDTTRRIIHIDSSVNPQSIYLLRPENTTGILLTSGAGVYAKGAYIEVLPAGGITGRFYLHAIFLDGGAAVNYEVDVATGAFGSETIIATITHSMNGMEYMQMPCILIPANTRLSARCSDSAGGNTILTKIRYRISRGG